jgi:hypothetical protein
MDNPNASSNLLPRSRRGTVHPSFHHFNFYNTGDFRYPSVQITRAIDDLSYSLNSLSG